MHNVVEKEKIKGLGSWQVQNSLPEKTCAL